jgi:DNA phosphorothioation-dependent restriction protein DptH
MSVKQFEGFLADQFFTWAQSELKAGFRYQFKSPNTDYCKRLFDAIEKGCTGSLTIKDTNISYIEFGEKKLLIVLHNEDPLDEKGFTENFISMLRDEVSAQVGVMSGCAMLVIHNSLLDTLINSAQDLAQPESVWHPKKIKLALKALIDEKDSGRGVSEGLLDYQFNVIEEDDSTMFGFETLYDAVCDGEIKFRELDMFSDQMLFEMDDKPEQIRRRLEENRKLFEQVSNVVENYPEALVDNLPDLGKKFINENFLGEDKQAWQQVTYLDYRNEQQKNRAKFLELDLETAVQVEVIAKSKADTKAGKRNRHILLVVPEEAIEFDLEIPFYGGTINSNEIKLIVNKASPPLINYKLTSGAIRSKIIITGAATQEPLFFRIDINRDKTSEKYQFHCLVLQEYLFNIDDFRHIFLVDDKKERLILQTEESSLILNPELQSSVELNDYTQCIDVNEIGALNFQKMANESDEIEFTLKNKDVTLDFYIEGATATEALTLPLLLDRDRCVHFFNDEYFGIFNRPKSKVLIDNREVSPKGRRLTLLQREHDILRDDLLYSRDGTESVITIESLKPSSLELSNAYKALFDYLKQQRSLISLSSWGESLINLVGGVTEKYQNALASIPENTLLNTDQKILLRIGFWENENGKWMTPYHPVILAYYLNLAQEVKNDSDSFSRLPSVTINRLNPQGLVPFLFDTKSDFTYSRTEQDNSMWIQLVPQQNTSYAFVRRLVKDKVTEFKAAFSALFAGNPKSPLIINSINNGDNNELFLGLVDYMRGQVDRGPSIHVNLYDKQLTPCEFDYFSETSSYDEIKLRYGLDKGKARENADVVIDLLRTRLTYSKFTTEESTQEYAHLSFFRNNEKVEVMQVDIDEEECGVICRGLINGEASYSKQKSYITGFGLKSLDYSNQQHLKITKLFSTLLQPAERTNFPYRHSSAISLAVSDNFKTLLERSYDSSIWTTIIDPKVTLDFFKSSKDVVLIHYSDQYTNSASYDAITVSRQTDLYNKVLEKDKGGIIGEFNAFNGEWLLKMITADPKIRKERKGILGAYKFLNCMLKDSDITWVPLSIGEVIRVSGNIGLKITDSDFSRNVNGYKSGAISDDVLFVGFKDKKMYLLPLEVKTGSRPDYKKAIKQARELKRYLAEDILGQSSFSSGLFRGLFIRQVIMQIDKYQLYNVYSDDYFKGLLDSKEWWLQGEYELAEIQDYPHGMVLAHVENSSCFEPKFEEVEKVLKIELPMSLLANLVSTPLERLMTKELPSALSYCPEQYLLKTLVSIPEIHQEAKELVEIENEVTSKNKNIDQESEPKKEQPPVIKATEGSLKVLLGHEVLNNNSIDWEPTNTAKYMNPNMGIIGTMGTGKTQCTKSVITQLYRNQDNNVDGKHIGMLIFDYKSDYVDDKFCDSTLAKKYKLFKLPYNPLSLYGDTPMLPVHTAAGFSETMSRAFGLGNKQQLKLENLILEAYSLAGILPENPSTWSKPAPTIENIWDLFLDQEKVEEDSLYAALSKLARFKIFETDPEKMVSLFELLDGVIVIELAGYPSQVQNLIVALTLDLFYSQMQKKGKPEVRGDFRQLSKLILVDEADNFMSQNFPSLRKVLKEGREYGVGIVLSTQDITHFKTGENDYSAYILSWVIHRVSQIRNQDIKALFNIDNKSEQENLMSSIRGLEKHYSLYVDGDKNILKMKDKAFWEL